MDSVIWYNVFTDYNFNIAEFFVICDLLYNTKSHFTNCSKQKRSQRE